MSKLIILVFSLFGLLSVCVGQVVQDGQCDPNVPLADNFDIQQFLGTWYEVFRLDNPDQGGDCSSFEFTNTSNVLEVSYSSVNNNFIEDANGTVSQDGNTPKLSLSISSFSNPIDFWVLRVVYDTYATAFACENISTSQRKIHIWILGKEREISPIFVALISTTILNTFEIPFSAFTPIDHSTEACHILPVIEPGDPIILPGQCDPNLRVVENFDVNRFLGVWHQISSYETPNSNGTCVRAEYTWGDEVVNVLNSQVIGQELLTIDGIATVNSTDNNAKLSVVLNIPGAPPTPQNLWILVSDYDNYAISYTCVNYSSTEKRVFSWILSRTRELLPSSEAAVDEAVYSYLDLNYLYYKPTNQSDAGCFFYPEPVPNEPVVFRGQCESVNVRAMQNFEIDRYLGTWHNIELYPSRFQNGTCSNAFYELVDGSVAVVNSQVNNQSLETVNAVAVPASTDGSAKLVVTFPVAGTNETVSSDYWVLDTDYTNYALVYTCSNVGIEEMQVSSWKLSRTKELTIASETAINEVINNVTVLDQRYYRGVNQTVEGCFYFPEAQDNVPVVFPGQCDENIDVVQNLDFLQFQGVWNEIQAYPKAEQSGHCINHQYTLVNNTLLNVEYSSITDQFLMVANGVVIRSNTTDSSGRLTISITDANGAVKNIPFWILNTDYQDFAFAYACENINQDFRGVWSWKLSRTKQLSPEANVTINNIIANNIVLNNNYFRNIDQSDEACFYLPEIERGEPVVLPGQCNTTIGGIPNFNISAYVGRWRLIESYGSEFQVGTCNVDRYTLQAGNILDITNSQVVNEHLATISGIATISSTDGSGQLRFFFPNRGQTFNYTILATDYDTYALGYSCVNLENNQRRVYSWKMSRENTLSQDAIDNIDEIIDSIQVLNNRFYYSVNHTDTGCFYFPTPNPSSSVRFRGQCDQSISVVTNFQPEEYLGIWYDIESYPEAFQDGTCNTANYSPGNDVDVLNTQVVNQVLVSMKGTAVLEPSTDGSAKLQVTFNVQGVNVSANYWVLATDYNSYSLVYSCRAIDDEYVQVTSWKLSRTKTLTSNATNAINNVMSNIRTLDQRYFIPRNQTLEGCFYFPEPQPSVPVVFPGQCDDSIAAMSNFNMSAFLGIWHEIEAYPRHNQRGECINHQYSLVGNNTLNLQSSNVFEQTLNLNISNVSFSSIDGSGKLIISNTLNNGTVNEITYWILDTDYFNYALVYSCVNISSHFREVFSWKLSRTKELDVSGSMSINNTIANIDVLDNRYFEDIDQSDRACFHLPEIAPGDDVILPGRCDPTIGGIPNFNISMYAGEWRLIESYGSGYQNGTCNRARYTLRADNTLDVINTQVVNEQLVTISGTANISSSDGSGQLHFYLSNQEYEVYIINTDYVSYALAYGCTNLENQQRRVTSWKFSRSDTLSQAANDSINEKINENEVLHQPYYYSVDHSPYSCFYFPDPDKNTPVRFRGQCDENIQVVSDFDVGRYLGLWHDIESYPMAFQDGDCPNAYYGLSNSTTVTVYNTQVIDQSLNAINGVAIVASEDGSAKLNVTFNVANNEDTSDYWVLDTDYTSYALVYSCRKLNDDYISVASWKLSRTKTLTSNATNTINEVMRNSRVLDQRYFVPRNQTPEGCFYFPKPQLGVPVVFPGQCDDSIAAVANFSMNYFQGTWHEIAAYPRADQYGQCFSQQFNVNSTNSMRLDSFNVLNQAQSTTEGHVTFASDDGSGKLNINIWVNGEVHSIPYWILSTNYTDYALAYSCININSDYRGVWSWKLSRTRQLSDTGNVAINNTIANINVLRNDYYEYIQQTDSACFYLPELGPSDPVIFPGRCDPNISVIQNFNASRYLGRWRLIESYYSEFQNGACNAATYSLAADGSVIVLNTQVINEQLDSIRGSAVPAFNDGSGKLNVTFPNSTSATDYWILDTDYDSYALIYTCVDLPDDQRRVWSWKMSRTNTLTVNATNSINQIVNSVDVLDDRYYQIIDRTESGCFYNPTPDINFNVIFPGQCNESIPAFPNFNATLYAGTWYDVESYPTNFQNGTCNTATYSLNTDGTLNVQNTQVVEQLLETVKGYAVPTSNDGTAKFDVTLISSSGSVLTTKYWVLDTDYETYSLVYSCRNIDDEFREVYSWKLGRQPTLPTDAVTAINAKINTVQVLNQQHFVQRNHTEEACFYYPDNQGGDVIMDGQCVADAQVPAVTDFDANAFAGTWHEVARFPSTLQNGECTATEYSLRGANSFDVIQTSVIDEALLNTTAQAELATDGRGVISLNINGVPFNDVYILATNYNEYTLAYSCRNLEGNRKQIYSWKLSRSRAGLSDEANNVINEVVNGNIDLFEPYYLYPSQDDTACFYYPVFDQLPQTIELPGHCNTTISGVPNFNVAAYLGKWFELARYPQLEQSGQCSRAEYALLDSGAVSVVNSEVIHEVFGSMTGEANIASTDGSGLLYVTFNVGGVTRGSNYYVLATDYTSYALVYSCANLTNGNRRVGSWKLSRGTELSAQANADMDDIINATQGLNQDYYQGTSQSDESCFYYPVFEQLPPTIELPGPCNNSIRGVANFNAAAYVGTWFEIARYPQPDQSGQCSRAEYAALDSGAVSVVNSQVINETLFTMAGEATVTSNDNFGELEVVFNVGGEIRRANLYVLVTDYTEYALTYSCANLPNGNRRVGSWKLSRTTELSAQANAAMDLIINATQGLNQDYYQSTSQSDESCFYYPVFEQLPPAIELPGPCDTSIRGIPNFDAAAYIGTWIEIARYPQTEQSGQCSRAEYAALDSGAVSVVNSQVINETLFTMAGEATVTSDDNFGELEVVFNVGGEIRRANLYVLITDYTNYALTYSCANLPNGNRRVGSWKLSRTTELSAQANAAMDVVIDATQGLKEDYYQPTNQNIESCFHYPTQTGAQVVLPGQCDEDIPVVPSFNVTVFDGIWYQIQRYDAVEGRSCIGTRLSYDEGSGDIKINFVEVLNEEVLRREGSGRLNTTDGSGKFSLVMPTNGSQDAENIETIIYILATDYEGYALAYSCKNIDISQRQVGVWQLSRERTMPAAGATAIAQIIEQRQELHVPYFKPISQDEECPEPSSAILFKSSIIVIFVCSVLQLVW